MNQNRQPAGSPSGGQFAPGSTGRGQDLPITSLNVKTKEAALHAAKLASPRDTFVDEAKEVYDKVLPLWRYNFEGMGNEEGEETWYETDEWRGYSFGDLDDEKIPVLKSIELADGRVFGFDKNGALNSLTSPSNESIHWYPDGTVKTLSLDRKNWAAYHEDGSVQLIRYEDNVDGACMKGFYPSGEVSVEQSNDGRFERRYADTGDLIYSKTPVDEPSPHADFLSRTPSLKEIMKLAAQPGGGVEGVYGSGGGLTSATLEDGTHIAVGWSGNHIAEITKGDTLQAFDEQGRCEGVRIKKEDGATEYHRVNDGRVTSISRYEASNPPPHQGFRG